MLKSKTDFHEDRFPRIATLLSLGMAGDIAAADGQ
jgi:hypothetical protein